MSGSSYTNIIILQCDSQNNAFAFGLNVGDCGHKSVQFLLVEFYPVSYSAIVIIRKTILDLSWIWEWYSSPVGNTIQSNKWPEQNSYTYTQTWILEHARRQAYTSLQLSIGVDLNDEKLTCQLSSGIHLHWPICTMHIHMSHYLNRLGPHIARMRTTRELDAHRANKT